MNNYCHTDLKQCGCECCKQVENEERETIQKTFLQVLKQREEILKAFLAKYKCDPSEIVQVEKETPSGRIWYVERRNQIDEIKIPFQSGKKPHKCPVCEGMPVKDNLRHEILGYGKPFDVCSACEGKGIVWG